MRPNAPRQHTIFLRAAACRAHVGAFRPHRVGTKGSSRLAGPQASPPWAAIPGIRRGVAPVWQHPAAAHVAAGKGSWVAPPVGGTFAGGRFYPGWCAGERRARRERRPWLLACYKTRLGCPARVRWSKRRCWGRTCLLVDGRARSLGGGREGQFWVHAHYLYTTLNMTRGKGRDGGNRRALRGHGGYTLRNPTPDAGMQYPGGLYHPMSSPRSRHAGGLPGLNTHDIPAANTNSA